jgi:very-short-patch-repair endonuclease
MDWGNLQEDYERLGSFKAVAAEYGTYPATVSRAAKRLGIATQHSKHIDWSGLRELYDSGMGQDEIAEHYGCSASLVSMAMKTLGIQARPGGPSGWKWTGEQHRKRREAVARGAFEGAQRERFRRLGKSAPKENSPSECLLHQALIKAGLSFETQSRELGRYWPDVKLHQQPILLEVDGWAHGMPARKQHDENRDAALTAAGFTVVRFSNEEIDTDPDGCVQRLTERFGLARDENPAAIIRDRRSYE